MVVPVTRWAPITMCKEWASNPKADNFLPLNSFDDLEDPGKLSRIVGDACMKTARNRTAAAGRAAMLAAAEPAEDEDDLVQELAGLEDEEEPLHPFEAQLLAPK